MKWYAMLLALTPIPAAVAAQVDLCNLNTQYGYQVTADTVRIENERGQVLGVSKGGLTLDGKLIKPFALHDPEGVAFQAALRGTIPAAAELSRLSYERSLSGLARGFYSRNRDQRWVPYVRGYYQAMLDRYDAAIETTPVLSIQRAGLLTIQRELSSVAKQGLTIETVNAASPVSADGVTVEQERERLDQLASGNSLSQHAEKMCGQVRELAVLQSKALGGTGLAGAFEIAVRREH